MLGHQGQNGSGVRPISQGVIQIKDGGAPAADGAVLAVARGVGSG